MRKFLFLISLLFVFNATVQAAIAPTKIVGATTTDVMLAKMIHEKRQVLFVDLRSAEDFNKGHIPGAKNLPMAEFNQETLSALVKKGDSVLFYCGGITCVDAAEASKKALEWGWKSVYYFRNGYSYWTKVGLEVE